MSSPQLPPSEKLWNRREAYNLLKLLKKMRFTIKPPSVPAFDLTVLGRCNPLFSKKNHAAAAKVRKKEAQKTRLRARSKSVDANAALGFIGPRSSSLFNGPRRRRSRRDDGAAGGSPRTIRHGLTNPVDRFLLDGKKHEDVGSDGKFLLISRKSSLSLQQSFLEADRSLGAAATSLAARNLAAADDDDDADGPRGGNDVADVDESSSSIMNQFEEVDKIKQQINEAFMYFGAKTGLVSLVASILTEQSGSVNAQDRGGRTILHLAAL